jgi:hypothetical protein
LDLSGRKLQRPKTIRVKAVVTRYLIVLPDLHITEITAEVNERIIRMLYRLIYLQELFL